MDVFDKRVKVLFGYVLKIWLFGVVILGLICKLFVFFYEVNVFGCFFVGYLSLMMVLGFLEKFVVIFLLVVIVLRIFRLVFVVINLISEFMMKFVFGVIKGFLLL